MSNVPLCDTSHYLQALVPDSREHVSLSIVASVHQPASMPWATNGFPVMSHPKAGPGLWITVVRARSIQFFVDIRRFCHPFDFPVTRNLRFWASHFLRLYSLILSPSQRESTSQIDTCVARLGVDIRNASLPVQRYNCDPAPNAHASVKKLFRHSILSEGVVQMLSRALAWLLEEQRVVSNVGLPNGSLFRPT